MTADVQQVGGTHYAGVGHWDLMDGYDIAYLPATATKYVVRWRKKGGVEDLKKAVTYLQKMDGLPARRLVSTGAMLDWRQHNRFEAEDWKIMVLILDEQHGQPQHIREAIKRLQDMIAREESK